VDPVNKFSISFKLKTKTKEEEIGRI
jgi:hypothetical protein